MSTCLVIRVQINPYVNNNRQEYPRGSIFEPRWPQFPAIQRLKDPNYHCNCV